jgi:N-acetylglucosamine-6-phosphate deacetylase
VAAALVGGELVRGDVEIAGNEVVSVGLSPLGSGYAVPGLVDLQVNGYAGIDVLSANPEELREMGRALARDGVLWYLPTVVTAPIETMREALSRIGAAARRETAAGATILGAHLEGPFLAAGRAGAHPVGYLRNPSTEVLDRLLGAGCPVRLLTLAPELEGADEMVEELVRRRVVVAVGHTDADRTAAHRAFDLGARAATHLFNAMRPFSHRDPGVVGAALARDDVIVTLIADGVHLDAEALLLAWRAARHRVALVSDAMAGARHGDGVFPLGTQEATVVDGVARRWDGTLAGSVRSLSFGLRRFVEVGVPLQEAVDAVTRTPARLIDRPDVGALRPGGRADLVVLDDALNVYQVLLAGIPVE